MKNKKKKEERENIEARMKSKEYVKQQAVMSEKSLLTMKSHKEEVADIAATAEGRLGDE